MLCYTHSVNLGSFYTFSDVILITALGEGGRMISLGRDTLGENRNLRDMWGF